MNLNRRSFLRGAGGALVALPHLNVMAKEATAVPMRMVCVGTNFGFVPNLFFPKETGLGFKAPELIHQLEQHRRNFTIFSGWTMELKGLAGTVVCTLFSRVFCRKIRAVSLRKT